MINKLDKIDVEINEGKLVFKNFKVSKGIINIDDVKKLNIQRKAIRASRNVDPKTLGRRLG